MLIRATGCTRRYGNTPQTKPEETKMNRLRTLLAGVLLAGVGLADVDNKDFNIAVVGNTTNSASYVIRGALEGVYVNVPAGTMTGTVTVATAHETLFTRAITADGIYRPRVSTHTTAGAAATFNVYSNTAATASAELAQTWYDKAAMAGPVTVTVVQDGPGTNWVVTLIYDK
jgi:hypothetical protein